MTTNKINLAEQNFEQFIPLIKKYYPNGKLDQKYAKDLVAAYQAIDISEDVLIALYDNSSASVFFVSDNVKKHNLTPETVIRWGGLLFFKMLFKAFIFVFLSFFFVFQRKGRFWKSWIWRF